MVGWFLGGPCSVFPKNVEHFQGASCWGWGEQKWKGEGREVLTSWMPTSISRLRWVFIIQMEMASFLVVDVFRKDASRKKRGLHGSGMECRK